MTVKITFTRYEKYVHVTTFGLHETPQQAFTKFRNLCSGILSYFIFSYLILIQFWSHFTHFCLFRFVSVDLLLVSVQSKHRNLLFRYRSETTETKVLFRIVPKLVCFESKLFSKDTLARRLIFLEFLKASIADLITLFLHHYKTLKAVATAAIVLLPCQFIPIPKTKI